MGTFIPTWVKRLENEIALPQVELRVIKRFLRVIASGGRLVMREYARIKEVSEGEARELRQLSIAQFVDSRPQATKGCKKLVGKANPKNSLVDSIWGASDRSSECRLEWRGGVPVRPADG